MDADLLRAIQRYLARGAITSSSMRGAGCPGVLENARAFLGVMPLRPFGTSSESRFISELDAATEDLVRALPKKARHWGRARKGLNIFLRGCLYTIYLRTAFHLDRAEQFFEVPLDSITGARLVRESRRLRATPLPRWATVKALSKQMSGDYQSVAQSVAAETRIARVHLDAMWWGEREAAESAKDCG